MILLPTRERVPFAWEYLQKTLGGILTFAEYTSITSESGLIEFYQQCRARKEEGFDGAIIKRLDAPYFNDVLKIKPEETVDAVVVGADLNRKGEVKTLLLAVPCHERKSWVPIAKVAKTRTDWDAVWSACQPHILDSRPDDLDNPPTVPDIWIAPRVVVTIIVTLLESSKAYQVHGSAARDCVLREDKGPEEATSFEQVCQIAGLRESSNYLQPSLFDGCMS